MPISERAREVAYMLDTEPNLWFPGGEGFITHPKRHISIITSSGVASLTIVQRWSHWDVSNNTTTMFATPDQRFIWGAVRRWQKQFKRLPSFPKEMGLRAWYWSEEHKLLMSPFQGTKWHNSELRCDTWSTSKAVRGVAGIHAARLYPHWDSFEAADAFCCLQEIGPSGYSARAIDIIGVQGLRQRMGKIAVVGVVERFDRFVLGTNGWRAEWVIIRKLLAPNTEIGLKLEQAYPDVEVIYGNR